MLAFLAGGLGCKPEYPACETDKDCKDKEFCVARKCQMCRDSSDCGAGKECVNGACKAIPGYCTGRSDCKPGQDCINNQCRACVSDTECPSGTICLGGVCDKPQCKKDDDCAQDQDCQKGRCVTAVQTQVGPPCPLDTVYFGFDQFNLNSESTAALAKNVSCLKKSDRPVDLVGHADPRGTTEYNMALSDRRSQAVKDYLKRAGIPSDRLRPVPRGALDATGSDDSSWSRDRRVDSEWR
jgi:peptidoglycan-associated lipoprotein